MKESPSYYAIIPANVRYDENLKPNSKLLYGEITALASKNGVCYASNNYFAQLYNVDISTISKCITQLKDKDYIQVDYIVNDDKTKRRIIRLRGIEKFQGVLKNRLGGYCKNTKENNTSNNTIDEIREREIFDYDWMEDDDI